MELTPAELHFLRRLVQQHMAGKLKKAQAMQAKFGDAYDPTQHNEYVEFARQVLVKLPRKEVT